MGGPGPQCWGIEELVAKTGDLACDLSTAPTSFNASHRFIKMTLSVVTGEQSHLGSCAQRNIKARVGQQR